MNIREAINRKDFNIIGLTAENFERRLKLRLTEIDTDERREPKIKTWQEAKRYSLHRLLLNPVRGI